MPVETASNSKGLRGGINLLKLTLPHVPLASELVVDGTPNVGWLELAEGVGVWEHTVGVSTDIEVDEIFVVLSGSGRVDFEGDRTSLTLAAGTIASLATGERTTWSITETVRKVYWVAGVADTDDAVGVCA